MEQQEQQIPYGGGEFTFPDTWKEESLRWFSNRTELADFHSLYPHPNKTVPFLPEFDPSSHFGCIAENSSIFRYHLPDLNFPPSSDGSMPLWQSDTSTGSDSLPSPVASEFQEPPWRPGMLLRFQKHELQTQIDQVVNRSPFHPVPEAELELEMGLPSNQSPYGIMNTLLSADQQIMMDQIVGMNHLSSFQLDETRNQMPIIISESSQIYHSNCSAFVIHGSQGENFDCSIDGVLSNRPTGKRIRTFEEDITERFDGSALSLACLPSDCSSYLPLQTMPVQQVSEISVAKKQKTEIGGSEEASATPPKAPVFYNFLGLPHNVYVAERDANAYKFSNSWEDCYDVDLELKL